MLAINGASAALSISGIPFQGPIGAVRIAYSQEGTWVPHPTFEEVEESTFELIVAGRGVGDDVAIMMVEAGGTEKAWDHYENGAPKVTEEVIADGLEGLQGLDQGVDRPPEPAHRPGRRPVAASPRSRSPPSSTTATT